ncbi:hypothetical protein CMV_002718 [Castanea mollissima]|uniref:Uncharacterized protein n=1 Tax=Castanea mollissima TaxID=60419 RepID=A0A8J4VWR8_9ROSI|nr:hypothetical protein CMV_002718 [Castanea mollissima]
MYLKTCSEVQRCFLTVGLAYPEDLSMFLLNKCRMKEEPLTFGALSDLKHLLLSPLRVDCALPDRDRNELGTSKEVFGSSGTYVSSQCKRSEVKIGAVCPTESRAICEKGHLLLTFTIPKIEALALSTCTTLVSVEPKLMVETQNHLMKGTLGFFALPNDSVDVVNPLIDNLITLLCAILLTRGGLGSLLEQMVEVLCQHVSDESPTLRQLCLRGLVQILYFIQAVKSPCGV